MYHPPAISWSKRDCGQGAQVVVGLFSHIDGLIAFKVSDLPLQRTARWLIPKNDKDFVELLFVVSLGLVLPILLVVLGLRPVHILLKISTSDQFF